MGVEKKVKQKRSSSALLFILYRAEEKAHIGGRVVCLLILIDLLKRKKVSAIYGGKFIIQKTQRVKTNTRKEHRTGDCIRR